MKRVLIILLCVLLLVGCTVEVTLPKGITKYFSKGFKIFEASDINMIQAKIDDYDVNRTFTQAELFNDFDSFIADIFPAFNNTDIFDVDMNELLKQTRAKITEGMTEKEFQNLLDEVHRAVPSLEFQTAPSFERENYIAKNELVFPYDVVLSNGVLYIDSEEEQEILEINGIPTEDILNAMKEVIVAPNELKFEYLVTEEFKLHYYEIYGSTEDFIIKVNTNGDTKELNAKGIKNGERTMTTLLWSWGLRDSMLDYSYGYESGYSFSRIVLKTFDAFSNFDLVMDDMQEKLQNDNPDILVIDLRHCNISSPEAVKLFYSKFNDMQKPFFVAASNSELVGDVSGENVFKSKKIFVITDASMNSLVNQLAIKFRELGYVTICGAPISSGTIGFNNRGSGVFENTKIRYVYMKDRADIAMIEEYPNGVAPHVFDENVKFKSRQLKFFKDLFDAECQE